VLSSSGTKCSNASDFQVGDALESVPAASNAKDVYLLSALLHGFNDAACIRILQNASRAAAPAGALIVVMEMVLAEGRAHFAETSVDMQMFMGTEGRERTRAEWGQIFERSGLKLQEVVLLASLGRMMVLRPLLG
jgi:hypothetical protein